MFFVLLFSTSRWHQWFLQSNSVKMKLTRCPCLTEKRMKTPDICIRTGEFATLFYHATFSLLVRQTWCHSHPNERLHQLDSLILIYVTSSFEHTSQSTRACNCAVNWLAHSLDLNKVREQAPHWGYDKYNMHAACLFFLSTPSNHPHNFPLT